MDFIPGEIVRIQLANGFASLLREHNKVRFEFVIFLGTFDGQAVVQNANGHRQLAPLDTIAHIPLTELQP